MRKAEQCAICGTTFFLRGDHAKLSKARQKKYPKGVNGLCWAHHLLRRQGRLIPAEHRRLIELHDVGPRVEARKRIRHVHRMTGLPEDLLEAYVTIGAWHFKKDYGYYNRYVTINGVRRWVKDET